MWTERCEPPRIVTCAMLKRQTLKPRNLGGMRRFSEAGSISFLLPSHSYSHSTCNVSTCELPLPLWRPRDHLTAVAEFAPPGQGGVGPSVKICHRNNVSPWVEGRTLWRDEFTVWTSENSPSQVYDDMVDLSLFYAHFSLRTPVCNKKITVVGHAVDHSVGGVESCFSCASLLKHDHPHIFEFRRHRMIVSS